MDSFSGLTVLLETFLNSLGARDFFGHLQKEDLSLRIHFGFLVRRVPPLLKFSNQTSLRCLFNVSPEILDIKKQH